MTLTQFNATRWGAGMMALYDGEQMLVEQVDFKEQLVGLRRPEDIGDDDVETLWVRCENVTLLNPQQ